MPLFKGKKNMGRNIKTEMAEGKPQKQAVAIAYREAGEKKAPAISSKKGGFTPFEKKLDKKGF